MSESEEPKPKIESSPPKRRGLSGFFLRGLITLAPVVLTIVAFGLAYQMVERYVVGPINSVIYWSLETNGIGWRVLRKLDIEPLDVEYLDVDLLPIELAGHARELSVQDQKFKVMLKQYRDDSGGTWIGLDSPIYDLEELAIDSDKLRDRLRERVPPLLGIFLSVLLVLWLGWLVGGFLGRQLVTRVDRTMHAIPIVKSVYPYSKQLVEFFFAEKKLEFDTVVVIPYPSPNLYSLAFITGNSLKSLRAKTGKTLISCFVPSSPMPMTGYTIFVESHRVIPMPISVDEALRITRSGGVLVPTREILEGSLEGEFQAHLAQKQAEQEAQEQEQKQKRKARIPRIRKRKEGEEDDDDEDALEHDEDVDDDASEDTTT